LNNKRKNNASKGTKFEVDGNYVLFYNADYMFIGDTIEQRQKCGK